jgi:hypothetical protein
MDNKAKILHPFMGVSPQDNGNKYRNAEYKKVMSAMALHATDFFLNAPVHGMLVDHLYSTQNHKIPPLDEFDTMRKVRDHLRERVVPGLLRIADGLLVDNLTDADISDRKKSWESFLSDCFPKQQFPFPSVLALDQRIIWDRSPKAIYSYAAPTETGYETALMLL